MKVRQTPIAAAVALTLLSTGALAQAQQTAPKPAENQQLEQVVVTGIRASQEKSLSVKRNADAHIDVVSAEDIGKMPDKNVADSLARIPGVTVLNSPAGGSGGFDERDRVGLRGTNPSLTQTLVDSHAIANGDWFVLDQSGAGVGRSVSYSLLPSELVSRVEVRKNAEASLVEGGTAGSVNIITRKPLDFSKPLTIEASVGAVYADLPRKTDPQLSALLNFRSDDKTFGVLVQAFSEKRSLRRDGVETLGWINQLTKANAAELIAQAPGLEGAYIPDLIGAAYFTQERERKGGLVRAEFKPTKDVDLILTGFSSKMDADNYNRNYMLINRPGFTAYSTAKLGDYSVVTDKNGVKTVSKLNLTWTTPSAGGVYDMISRKASAESNFLGLEGTFKVNDALTLSVNGGTSKGKGKTDSQDVYEANIYTQAAGYQLNGNSAAPAFSVGIDPKKGINNQPGTSAAGMGFGWIFGVENLVVNDKDTWAQVDGEYTMDAGVLKSLKFGARSATHDRGTGSTVNQRPGCSTGTAYGASMFPWSGTFYCGANDNNAASSPSPYTIANSPAFSQLYPSNFGGGLGGGFPTSIAYVSAADLAAFNAKYTNRDPNSAALVHSPIQGGEYGVKETTTAMYVQGNLEGQAWSGNIGLRAVRTKQSSHAWTYTPNAAKPDVTSAWGAEYLTSNSRSYTDLLPSASIRIDISKDLVGRLALSRTMTRADYTALSAAANLSPPANLQDQSVGGGSAGNPNLKPIRSNNFDANLEWYFAPRAFVSMGAFHMQMGSYIKDGTFSATLPTLLAPAGGGAAQIVDRKYLLTGPINTSASVTGLEFAFESPINKNFGVSANYTFADGHDSNGHVLRGNVRHSVNLGGFYEDDKFSARVNYGYTDSIYIGTDRGTDYYQKGSGVLSASIGYKLTENFGISLDGQNLNSPKLKYFASDTQPRAIYNNGRQYYLTARVKF
ncbi:TonB-dependent receptor [Pelomonas sp. SE-A7]|uniref:TonB-dependent receptor n=1 Tax=Pelomonas sp. SE-A7 TaxID=3054953 RepID=UPI00259D20E1|nr:TonB-dependent receptor [Pelomonas sp. SE-A7]MDM4766821.1 TonB-dependent receptor [Pelomonas sp. SE-A7]